MAENRWEFFFLRYLIVCFVSEIVWWGKENVKQIREAFWARGVSSTPRAPVIRKIAYILWAWSMRRNFQAQIIAAVNKRWKTNL